MTFRKLRIAWSVFWGLACVLLIVLWVRSYWWCDQVGKGISKSLWILCNSTEGEIELYWYPDPKDVSRNGIGWQLFHVPGDDWSELNGNRIASNRAKGRPPKHNFDLDKYGLRIPIWFLSLSAAILTSLPWLPRRFSLRTLLIATTLVAVLGLAVYAASK